MRTRIVICLAVIFVWFSGAPAAAQAPAPAVSQEEGGQMEPSGGPLIDRIDPERLRQIRSERTRQYVLGAGMMAAGGVVGFSKNEWTVDEGVVGAAIAALGLALFFEPITWRDLEVSTSSNGLSLEW